MRAVKLDDYRSSDNVEDEGSGGRSDSGSSGRRSYGGSSGRRMTPTSFVITVIILAIGYYLRSHDGSAPSTTTAPTHHGSPSSSASDPSRVFVSKVLATTEDAWSEMFRAAGKTYVAPKLGLFRGSVSSACGTESSAVGPFYCPSDRHAYLDLEFFDELRTRFGAPGDFAQAYVIAHEIGHHVQNLLGTSQRAERQGMTLGASGNSVRLELQADCYAGMWGAWAQKKGLLEQGDVEEAVRAAQAIGDDTLQRRARGRVTPDSFSHGSSAERVKWFTTGMHATGFEACDTFSARSLE
jgi:hypothetical protein